MNSQETGRLIGVFVLLVFATFFGFLAIQGYRTGRLLGKGGIYIRRDENPTFFAIALVCYFGFSAFGIFGAVKLLVMMFSKS
jgi:hypothetical protein